MPRMPAAVKALGERVKMTPISWAEYKDRIVIIFEQGPKLTFEREPEPVEIQAQEQPKPKRRKK